MSRNWSWCVSKYVIVPAPSNTYTTGVPVDVVTEIFIAKPRAEVAAFACDAANAPKWYANIASAERKSESHVTFVARFLGRRLEYTYEIVEQAPGVRFVMRTAEGPFPMETTYTFEDEGGGTRMTLRNRGEAVRFFEARRADDVFRDATREPQRPRGAEEATRRPLSQSRAVFSRNSSYVPPKSVIVGALPPVFAGGARRRASRARRRSGGRG